MLTQASRLSAADRRFLHSFESDEEDAPWMSVTDWHLLALIAALLPMRWFAALARPEWYIGSEIAVYFPEGGKRKHVIPDIFVALAPNHPCTSFDVEEEGGFPRFVLEIISEESLTRDTGTERGKVRLYDVLGVQEYAIFDPEGRMQPQLQGYRRTSAGEWVPWHAGARGELVSRVLGLTLVADETLLRLEDAEGRRLLTPDEERLRAEAAEARVARLQALLAERGITEDE
jgi:Uma2 family endonuclease